MSLQQNDVFSKVGLDIGKKYVINLDHREDRKQNAIDQLTSIGVTDYVVFPGLYTRSTGVVAHGLPNPGTTGCYLSHQFLFHEAWANKYKNLLVMEDDIQFVPDFVEKFPQCYSQVPPGWDLIWIGSNEFKKAEGIPITDNVSIPGRVWGAHCYLVSQTGIEKIYKYLNSKPIRNHVDVTLNKIPDLVQFRFSPSLCNQRSMGTDNLSVSTSFINNRNRFVVERPKKQPVKAF